MDWRVAAVITMLALGVYNILVKKFIETEDWRVMIPIVFAFSLILFIYFLLSYPTFIERVTPNSIFLSFSLAFIMGIAILFTYVSFKEGGPVNVVVPIFSLSTFISVVIAVVFMHEEIFPQTIAGIILSFIGLILLIYR
ncbi:MAG: EamA family transporter [Candidatus Micrarchaeia archaeon]